MTRNTPLVLPWVSPMPARTLPYRSSRAASRHAMKAGYSQNQSACRQVSGRPQRLTRITPVLTFALWTVPCRSALMMLSRSTEKMTAIGVMRGMYNRPACRAGGKFGLPTSVQSANPVLRHDHRYRRPSDRQQFLSWNPGPIRRADRVCWQAILGPRGMLSVCRRALDSATTSPSRKFLRGCPARLSRPRQQGHFRAKLFVCSALHPWQVDVCHLGCCGHGCYWQVPQSSR